MESFGGKYAGILFNKLKNGRLTFYIQFRNEENKPVRQKIGQSPDMTKSKALKILNEKKEEISQIKAALKGRSDKPLLLKKKKDHTVYTLNDLAHFYLKENKSNLKNPSDLYSRYKTHVENELFAQKAIQLIQREDLVEFIDKKKQQRADKRRYKQEDKTIEEKELSEIQKNQDKIDLLKEQIEFADLEELNLMINENKIKYLEKKNLILRNRLDPEKSLKIWNDKSVSEDDKKLLLGYLANKTIKEIIAFCCTIMNYAIYEKKLNIINPFIISKKDPKLYIKVDNVRDRYMTLKEIKVFLKEIKRISFEFEKHKNIYLMCMFGLSLAARQSTIMSIKIGDIDLETGNINLRNHKTEKWYNGYVATNEIKEEIIKLAGDRDQDEYLFLTYLNEKPYRYPRKVQEILDYTVNCHRPFLKWLSIKDFRNTAASHLAINGMPIQHISKVLDHADIRITQRYSKLSPDIAAEGIKGMINSFEED